MPRVSPPTPASTATYLGLQRALQQKQTLTFYVQQDVELWVSVVGGEIIAATASDDSSAFESYQSTLPASLRLSPQQVVQVGHQRLRENLCRFLISKAHPSTYEAYPFGQMLVIQDSQKLFAYCASVVARAHRLPEDAIVSRGTRRPTSQAEQSLFDALPAHPVRCKQVMNSSPLTPLLTRSTLALMVKGGSLLTSPRSDAKADTPQPAPAAELPPKQAGPSPAAETPSPSRQKPSASLVREEELSSFAYDEDIRSTGDAGTFITSSRFLETVEISGAEDPAPQRVNRAPEVPVEVVQATAQALAGFFESLNKILGPSNTAKIYAKALSHLEEEYPNWVPQLKSYGPTFSVDAYLSLFRSHTSPQRRRFLRQSSYGIIDEMISVLSDAASGDQLIPLLKRLNTYRQRLPL